MRDLSGLIDEGRVRNYSRLIVVAYVVGMIGAFVMAKDMIDSAGKPFGYDFITFWSASLLTLGGNAAGAFDIPTIFAAQQMAVPANKMLFLWHYPPTFQLVAAPLALLPYLVSYFVFVGLSVLAFVAAMRPIVPWREAGILLLALPGTFICVMHGQNSLLSAALLVTAIISIDRRPVLAGVCIGLLAYKPQLGVLFPLVLAVTGRWRVMWVAAATVVAYVGLATLVFGVELWVVFFKNLGLVREVLETGLLPWQKIPSAFVFLRWIGVPQGVAYGGQAVVAVGVAAVTVMVWWRCGPTLMAGAVLVTGTMLLTPYTFDYEMAIIAIPLAIIARHLVRAGANDGEKLALLVLAVSPIVMGPLVLKISIQVGFLALLAMFAWTVRLALARKALLEGVIPAVRQVPMLAAR